MLNIRHISIAVVAALLAGCQGEELADVTPSPDDGLVRVSFRLKPAATQGTRAVTDEGEEAGSDVENINSWSLVIADADNAQNNPITIDSNGLTSNVVRDEVNNLLLAPGQKRIYAVANTTANTNDEATVTVTNGFVPGTDGKYLPMSNIYEVNITRDGTYEIPVYRTMAKVEFRFFSQAGGPIKVKSLTMHHITSGQVYLFPQDNFPRDDFRTGAGADRTQYGNDPTQGNGNNGNNDNEPTQGSTSPMPLFPTATTEAGGPATTFIDYAPTLPGGSIDVPTTADSEDNAVKATYYINESVAEASDKPLKFTIEFERTTENGLTVSETNTLTTDLAYILRNDHVIIPVCFTDYVFQPRFALYPPIGGYAPYTETTDTDGNRVYTIKQVNAKGDFTLFPGFYNAYTGAQLPVSGLNFDYSNASIFEKDTSSNPKEPTYDASEGFVMGALDGTTGTCVVTIKGTVTIAGNNVTFERKVTIIVEE